MSAFRLSLPANDVPTVVVLAFAADANARRRIDGKIMQGVSTRFPGD